MYYVNRTFECTLCTAKQKNLKNISGTFVLRFNLGKNIFENL
jgi:hypothetical protein